MHAQRRALQRSSAATRVSKSRPDFPDDNLYYKRNQMYVIEIVMYVSLFEGAHDNVDDHLASSFVTVNHRCLGKVPVILHQMVDARLRRLTAEVDWLSY